MKKYAINILVILFLLTPFTLFANGCHANNDTIKVLAIGNSFSQDAVEQYLHELGEAEGITMIIGNMFIGGCSLERHVQNIRNNAPAYAYRKVEKDGEKTETRSMTIEKALADEKWDYISVQQASPLSGIYDSYKASLPELVNYIRERIGKETVLMVHQTWLMLPMPTTPDSKTMTRPNENVHQHCGCSKESRQPGGYQENYPFGNRHTKCTYLLYRRPYE